MNARTLAMLRGAGVSLVFALLLFPRLAVATPPLEWSLRGGVDVKYRSDEDRNRSVTIARAPGGEYSFEPNYNYFFELRQMAEFLRAWQVDTPTNPDFGGIIEAEAGFLADVIQTDNTLEAIVVWSTYAQVFGDTATYGENVRRAWTYCWRYPAWREEGAPGEDYYRNHNCAWGLFAVLRYEAAYGDTSHRAYADTCAAYMIDHPLSFTQSGAFRWINPFVTGWMAGNLYLWGEAMGNVAHMDTAVGMGNRLIAWVEVDPATRLTEERWAMSSGTVVWGICNSSFRRDPARGVAWVTQYGPLVDTFQPWRNAPDDGYDWDNAWNVAYANAHHAMYVLSGDPQYAANFQALTDTLLSYDTDDDGGIPATTMDPVTEDMTWISSYLWLMGVHNLAGCLPAIDAGILALGVEPVHPPFHEGDSLFVTCLFANFGSSALEAVHTTLEMVDPTGLIVSVVDFGPMGLGENRTVRVTWPLPLPGTYSLRARAVAQGDANPSNNERSTSVHVAALVPLGGQLASGITGEALEGRVVAWYLGGTTPAPYDTAWAGSDGCWEVQLPEGQYRLEISPRLPYPNRVETVEVALPSVELRTTFDRVADLVLADDDGGETLESYVLVSCDSLRLVARSWECLEGPPSVRHLLDFPEIPLVWLTGETTVRALEPAEQETLTTFVEAGGLLLLTGQNWAECGVGSLDDLIPVTFGGNTFDHILDLDVDDPYNAPYQKIGTAGSGSANNQRSQDILVPEDAPGVDAFAFVSYAPGAVAGVRFEGGGGRRIVLGFGIEGVGLPTNPQGFMPRHVLLQRCLMWLGGIATSPFAEDTPALRVLLSPSPARGVVRVTLSGQRSGPFTLGLYDLAGRQVARAVVAAASSPVSTVLDLTGVAPGHYVCRVDRAPPVRVVILP